jgi:hypothetical protein
MRHADNPERKNGGTTLRRFEEMRQLTFRHSQSFVFFVPYAINAGQSEANLPALVIALIALLVGLLPLLVFLVIVVIARTRRKKVGRC